MLLKRLSFVHFRNIAQEELRFGPGINCFVGDNGAGKTNAVDAVYYLSMCKSSLGLTDGQNIRHGGEFFVLDALYATDRGREERIACTFSRRTGKTLRRNGKEYERLADHVGLIPVVIVSPADGVLISDAADERRRFLNALIAQTDRSYLSSVMRYNAVLAERNRLLKLQPDETMLRIYDRQLVELGTAVHDRRATVVDELRPRVADYYRTLASDREEVELVYRSELNDRPFDELLLAARPRDLASQFTTSGIHRDDLVLRIGGYPLRKYGSQGQQKSFLIALKLAQYDLLAAASGERPLLLLDDLFDKLDAGRVEQLLLLVSDKAFGQIFITDCNPTRLRRILDRAGRPYDLFTVAEGRIVRERVTTDAEETEGVDGAPERNGKSGAETAGPGTKTKEAPVEEKLPTPHPDASAAEESRPEAVAEAHPKRGGSR